MQFDASPTKSITATIFLEAFSRSSPKKSPMRQAPYVPPPYTCDSDHEEGSISRNPFAVLHSLPSSPNSTLQSQVSSQNPNPHHTYDEHAVQIRAVPQDGMFGPLRLSVPVVPPIEFNAEAKYETEGSSGRSSTSSCLVDGDPQSPPPRVYDLSPASVSESSFFTAALDSTEESSSDPSRSLTQSVNPHRPHVVQDTPTELDRMDGERTVDGIVVDGPFDRQGGNCPEWCGTKETEPDKRFRLRKLFSRFKVGWKR